MTDEMSVMQAAIDLAQAGEAFMLLTVIDAQGHTPRNAGAKMIWRPNAEPIGTIGGGCFEQLSLESARTLFRTGSSGTEKFVLGAEAEQCCGGVMEVFFEHHPNATRLILFGAGHVARALTNVLRNTGLAITIVDTRSEWNSEIRFPNCNRLTHISEGHTAALEVPERTLVCIMTHSHDLDLDIVCELLPHPLLYLGLIGSESKRACFITRLAGRGFDKDAISKMRCPMGLGDMGKSPEQVAISVAGELLMKARTIVGT